MTIRTVSIVRYSGTNAAMGARFLSSDRFRASECDHGAVRCGRTSANLYETRLKPSNVTPAKFGKLFSREVDGYIYAQPLYLSGVRNVVFVATMHNTLYAFDADDASASTPIWTLISVRPCRTNPRSL
jgi:hypothetical protein